MSDSMYQNATPETPGLHLSPPTARLPARLKPLIRAKDRFKTGTITVVLPNGHKMTIRGEEPGPTAELHLHRRRFFRRVLMGGHLAFAEAYIDGDWDSPDLAALVSYFAQNEAALSIDGHWWARALSRVVHRFRANNKRGSRRNIAFHYDLGNNFYKEWLDPSMTYSSAVYATGAETLEQAQTEKYARMAAKVALKPGDHVLEIGCGWGGFAELAARQGAFVTALTLSKEQKAYAEARFAAAGLADRVEVRLQDYRDVTGSFDGVVSIEMIEAVGEAYWPVYFETIQRVLKPGGRAAIQAITIEASRFEPYRRSPDFIQRYIFPGGMLPTIERLQQETARAGLAWEALEAYGRDYARTLRLWRERFEVTWDRIAPLGFDERFRRTWRYYLAYCEGGFDAGSIDVVQIGLQRR
jgi:cyclopropane-fatty-acyl-phospholipid synthase